MTIKELRTKTGWSQEAFAEFFNIPKRTIEDWEAGRRTPVTYLVELMQYKLVHEKIISEEDFYLTREEFFADTDEDQVCEYECMECGCTFYGRWHSSYTMHKVKCPVCQDETDPLFIQIKEVTSR